MKQFRYHPRNGDVVVADMGLEAPVYALVVDAGRNSALVVYCEPQGGFWWPAEAVISANAVRALDTPADDTRLEMVNAYWNNRLAEVINL